MLNQLCKFFRKTNMRKSDLIKGLILFLNINFGRRQDVTNNRFKANNTDQYQEEDS